MLDLIRKKHWRKGSMSAKKEKKDKTVWPPFG
jgi:hypothetical protein